MAQGVLEAERDGGENHPHAFCSILVVGKQVEDIKLGIHQEGQGKANHLLAGDQVQKKVNKT